MTTYWNQKRKTIRSYDCIAETYNDRYADEQEAKYRAALENVKPSGNILDVGCGTGIFFKHVANRAKILIGIDSSKKLLFEAMKNTPKKHNIHLVQADADHLPFNEGLFNAIFAFTVLQNMPKPVETLNELNRVAKTGAKVIFTGLKKVFSVTSLHRILNKTGLHLISIIADDSLKCHVLITLKSTE